MKLSSVVMSCKLAARSSLRRRKNYACFVSLIVLCAVAWLHLADYDASYTPLRPLLDAESEARRLLAFMTHYHYQCNTTAGPIGNWTMWPLCVGHEAGLSLDSKDAKLMYTIGASSDLALERSLALNHSFEVNVVTRHPSVARALHGVNNTHVIRTTIVPNDPADFSRNSFVQRTLNDLLAAQGHGAQRIDLLRLVATDSDAVSMADLVHFLVIDGVLKHVQHLHLTVYIDKLDEDYLYSWYRALYRLHSIAGFHLYHTSSHDTLCLQVTLMQSCVYFLSFVRNPGTRVYTMQPPADHGTLSEEWSRLQDYVTSVQLDCTSRSPASLSNVVFTPTATAADSPSVDDLLGLLCRENQLRATTAAGSCLTAVFSSSSRQQVKFTSQRRHECSLLRLAPVSDRSTELNINDFTLAGKARLSHSGGELMTGQQAVDELRRSVRPISIIIDIPRQEFNVINSILTNDLLRNVNELVTYVELPDISQRSTLAITLRSIYSVLRRLQSSHLSLVLSQPITACRSPQPPHYDVGNPHNIHRCYWLGFARSNLH